jgi:hypothetical protein
LFNPALAPVKVTLTVHGPVPVIEVMETLVVEPNGATLTWPGPAAKVGCVQVAGNTISAYELALKLFCPARKWKTKLWVLPGNALPGSIATVPSPLLSVNVHDAVS